MYPNRFVFLVAEHPVKRGIGKDLNPIFRSDDINCIRYVGDDFTTHEQSLLCSLALTNVDNYLGNHIAVEDGGREYGDNPASLGLVLDFVVIHVTVLTELRNEPVALLRTVPKFRHLKFP